jgi:hypothetical protein
MVKAQSKVGFILIKTIETKLVTMTVKGVGNIDATKVHIDNKVDR